MTVVLAIIGALIACATWWVGWQNMQIARVNLQHDLYDRRVRVFEATRIQRITGLRSSSLPARFRA